jgi:hypothetical protein
MRNSNDKNQEKSKNERKPGIFEKLTLLLILSGILFCNPQ